MLGIVGIYTLSYKLDLGMIRFTCKHKQCAWGYIDFDVYFQFVSYSIVTVCRK